MINYHKRTLANGLQVIVHEDKNTSLAVVNLLYDIGSRDENPEKTGFAHLFEHLMFGGSKHIPSFDGALQKVGGENNAFTSQDVTNYYEVVPAANLETALWLESDRMLSLNFDDKVLETQRKVVIEEFHQNYLNQPYGDRYLKLFPMVFEQHPYNWPTIGKEPKHIEDATMDDVKQFFFTHYRPDNAILVIAGNVQIEEAFTLADKYFGSIEAGKRAKRVLNAEPEPTEAKRTTVQAAVPSNAIYRAYLSVERMHPDYYAVELLCQILGQGKSSRLYIELVNTKKMFRDISCVHYGNQDKGMIFIGGKVSKGVSAEEAEAALNEVIESLLSNGLKDSEVEKAKNQAEAMLEFGEIELLNRAMNLAFATLNGDTELVNSEATLIDAVTKEDIERVAVEKLAYNRSRTLVYLAENTIANEADDEFFDDLEEDE